MGVKATRAVREPGRVPGSRRGRRFGQHLTAYAFLLPAIVLFALFAWYPAVYGFVLGFQRVNLVDPPQWAGLANFRQVLADPLFFRAWRNTLQYVGLGLLIGFPTPLLLAVAINEMRHLGGYFRLMFYLPAMLPPIATLFLWRWIYDPGPGLANTVLQALNLPPQPWLQSPQTAMLSIVIITTWAGLGGSMLIYLAALQGVAGELYEAAELEGASPWQRLVHITLPSIRFVVLAMLILQFIGTMQVFTEPFVLTDGGPANATETVALLLYRYAFQYGNYGAAGALGLILFAVLVTLSLLYFRVTRRFD